LFATSGTKRVVVETTRGKDRKKRQKDMKKETKTYIL